MSYPSYDDREADRDRLALRLRQKHDGFEAWLETSLGFRLRTRSFRLFIKKIKRRVVKLFLQKGRWKVGCATSSQKSVNFAFGLLLPFDPGGRVLALLVILPSAAFPKIKRPR